MMLNGASRGSIMKEKEMKGDSITSAGLIILVCGVLFIAIGVLIGIILTAHGAVVK